MELVERVGIFMQALSREGNHPKRTNLVPVMETIGVRTHEDALSLISDIQSPDGCRALKERGDQIHPHITARMSAEEVAAIISNAIATVSQIPNWTHIPAATKYPQPRIL